ncbi:pyrimidine 5'-nucleotidase [uncultured Paracoccus sp.]|uniref:pyrimidine 5'-nucleotidase n=1 Tax=uncultured Paracoccus sp. TaxID=189685 RepID=UPI0025F1F9DF|nr:pyrimidine 5'-nucleotidase [uncultured Paracoccus sp.]
MQTENIQTWIFDLDNTLYPAEAQLFAQIERRMTAYVMRELRLAEDAADELRDRYWRQHGTTLAGLMAEHGLDPLPYLRDVHDIDFSVLQPDPRLAQAIRALPGSKIVHTNGDSRYARRVLQSRGLDFFDAVFGVEEVDFHPKPDARAYQSVIAQHRFDPNRAVMFEDDPRNLLVPHGLGMGTVLVGRSPYRPEMAELDQDHGPHVHFHAMDLTSFLEELVT